MPKHLTDEDTIPTTILWRRGTAHMHPTIFGGLYKIVTTDSQYGSYKVYTLSKNNFRLDSFSSLREAKTGAEMHLLGLGTYVRFFNIPGKG